MVPVCSMMSRNVISGDDASFMPINHDATMTCAVLDTGNNSAIP